MSPVAAPPHVTLSGDRAGEYIVKDERPDGELTLVPDTSWAARLARHGERAMTPEESAEFWREHGPHMLPSDGEG